MQTAQARIVELLGKAKAIAAALAIAVPGLGTFLANLISSGRWDATEWRILASTFVLSLFAGAVVHQTPAGTAEVEIIPGSLELAEVEHMGPGGAAEVTP